MSKKQKIERCISILLPLFIFAIVFLNLGNRKNSISMNANLYDGIETVKIVIGIWATLLGFSITAESILISVRGGELTNLMFSSGHIKTMLFSFMITNIILFLCLVIFIPVILKGAWNFEIYRLFVCSISISFCSLGISLLYFFMILSTVNN